MKITNVHNLPLALVKALPEQRRHYDNSVSATRLLKPTQQNYLERKYWDDLVVDAADLIYALLGTSVHYLLEKGGSHGLAEQKLSTTLGDLTITGTPDLLEGFATEEGSTLWDYKVTTVYKVMDDTVPPDWVDQLMVYAWLFKQDGHDIQNTRVCAILRDWSKRKARYGRDPRYPQVGCAVMDVELPPEGEWLERISDMATVYAAAVDGDYLPCTPEQRWERGQYWAVTKPGRKTALRRVYTGFDDAAAWAMSLESNSDLAIEYHPGESIRCQDYCNVADYCPQWANLKKELNDATE